MTHPGAISTKKIGTGGAEGTYGTLNILLKFVTKVCLDSVYYLGIQSQIDLKGFVKENKLFRLTAQCFQNHNRSNANSFGTFLKVWMTKCSCKECKQKAAPNSAKV